MGLKSPPIAWWPDWQAAAPLAYLLLLGLATLSGFEPELDPAAIAHNFERALRPVLGPRDLVDGVRNVVLFAGWGVIWVLARAPLAPARAVGGALASGAAVSLCIESLQLLSATRTASVADLLTNSAGALLGALVLVVLIDRLRHGAGVVRWLGLPAWLPALALVLALSGEALIPQGRAMALPAASGGPLDRAALAFGQIRLASPGAVAWQDLALFACTGVMLALAWRERGWQRPWSAQVACGLFALLLLGLELARGFLGLPIVLAAVALPALVLSMAALTVFHALPAPRPLARQTVHAGLLLYLLALAIASWSPWQLVPDWETFRAGLSWSHWRPLAAHGEVLGLGTVTDICSGFMFALPIGLILARWPLGGRGDGAGLWPGIWVCVVIEGGQAMVAGRYFDITDLLVSVAGVVCGGVILRRADHGPAQTAVRHGTRNADAPCEQGPG